MSKEERIEDGGALIIGGSSGMGRAIAARLLHRGVHVHIVARETERLSKTKAELAKIGSVEASAVDLYDFEAVRSFASTIESGKPKIKYLVNAAGYFSPKPFLEHDLKDYDTYLDLNKATFFITLARMFHERLWIGVDSSSRLL